MKKINIALITLARSDYGILNNLFEKINENKKFDTSLITGAAHLSKFFGYTGNEIKIKFKKNFKIKYDYKKNNGINNYFAKNINEIENIIKKNKFDCCLILGDRYEALAIAIGFFNNRIPIIHLYGGSITRGSLDNKYRYCISSLASYHFVETNEHKNNLLKHNIPNKKIKIVGSLSLENYKKNLLSHSKFLKKFKLKFIKNKNIILCTFHPDTTINMKENILNLKILITFLKKIKQNILFTYPNADEGFNEYIKILNKEKDNKYFFLKKNLGKEGYFSVLNFADMVIGNSSSGIIETATFKIPTINIGSRQLGRVKNENVINSKFNLMDLNRAYKKANSKYFKNKISKIKNKYYRSNSSKVLLKNILENFK